MLQSSFQARFFFSLAMTMFGCLFGCSESTTDRNTGQTASPASPQPSPPRQTAEPVASGSGTSTVKAEGSTSPADAPEQGEESLEALLAGLSRPIGGNSFAVALNKRGESAVPGVLKALNSQDPATRKNAAFCLGLTWSTAQAAQKIAALLGVAEQDPDLKVRHQAAVAMAILARHDDVDPQLKVKIVPALSSAIENPAATRETRSHLVSVVGDMGHKGHPLIPAVITLLQDEDARTRGKAANAVGMLASPFPVEKGKVDPHGDVREYRASQESVDEAVAALVDALSDADAGVRAEAARGLSHIGRGAARSVPKLTQQLEDDQAEPRLRAAESLVRVAADPSAAIAVLEEAAGNDAATPAQRWWKTRAQRLLEEIDRTRADRHAVRDADQSPAP